MKVGILTSSRADFGIYLPLLRKFTADSFFQFEIIAFGTHLSPQYGNTIDEILEKGYEVKYRLDTLPADDSPEGISASMAKTIKVFSGYWGKHKFDLVFALGDRYEMFAAVASASPFNLKIAHIAGGETTLGAIDNTFRHSISLMSEYIFVSAEEYRLRACELIGKQENVYNVGALNIDNLINIELYSREDFLAAFRIDMSIPTILTTFHPETSSVQNNKKNIQELLKTIDILSNKYQIVITMPNADTMGLMIRKEIQKFYLERKNVILVESFGVKGYLSCMKYCSFLLGNTSSGFIEASFFPKWVINLGNRQKGRIITPNIKSIEVNKSKILEAVKEIENKTPQTNIYIYGEGNSAEKIIKVLKCM